MHHIQLSEQLYDEARRAALAGGFPSVDEFVADVMRRRLSEDAGNFDHRFNAEVVASLRDASAEARLGNNMTDSQVQAHFKAKRKSSLVDHSPGEP